MLATIPLVHSRSVQAEPVLAHPATVPERPRLNATRVLDGSVDDIEQVGNLIVMGGTFTRLRDIDGTIVTQAYLAAYNKDTGALVRTFNPVIDRPVYDLAPSPDGTAVYVVGEFSVVDGVTKRKIVKLTAAGDVVAGFTAQADSRVSDVVATGTRVYVGGRFSTINGVGATRLGALDATTGAIDPAFNFPLTDGVGINGEATTSALDLSADGQTLLVAHTARFIAGQIRVGLALITLGATPTLRPWRTRLYENNLANVIFVRITSAAISADGSYIVVGNTGGDRPPTNDTVIRFPTTGNGDDVAYTWVSRHFDSVYAVAISNNAVYVGGHFQFQEAPNSPEPWPGDSNINYGWGDTGDGAGVLAPFVLRREQLGALNPATGWSMNWNPGTDAYHGITSLTVIPDGLLAGGDMNRLGGINDIGRHGFFDFRNVPAAEDPQTSILSPTNGQLITAGGAIDIEGLATATVGVTRVDVDVRNEATGQYLRADGTFGAYAQFAATLANPGAASSTWLRSVTVPSGNYTITARTVATNGAKDLTRATTRVTIVSADTQRPDIGALDPPNLFQNFVSNNIVISGTATDNLGVASVAVEVINELDLLHLQADGTRSAAFHAFTATVTPVNSTNVTWSVPVTIPNGNWTVTVRATDINGNTGFRNATYRMFPNDQSPLIALSAPVATTQAPGPIRVAGLATDDSGIKTVGIYVFSVQTQNGVSANGTFGYRAWYVLPGGTPGQLTRSFDYSTIALPPGMYNVQAQVIDINDKVTTTTATNVLLQVANDALPETTIVTPANLAQTFATTTVAISGAASDDKGVVSVWLRVTRNSDGKRLQPDGSWANRVSLVNVATLANPGATSTAWSASLNLGAADRYAINAYAQDSSGQFDATLTNATVTYFVFPGDADPETTIAAPLNNAMITGTGRRINGNGEVTDNLVVASVEVRIANTVNGQGPRLDGTIGSPQWVPGALTNPGLNRSNYVFQSIVLPAGTYRVQVRARDNLGKYDLTPTLTTVTVQN